MHGIDLLQGVGSHTYIMQGPAGLQQLWPQTPVNERFVVLCCGMGDGVPL
jgi:hypothetical protein